jgi:hypothetical protein
MDIRELHYDFDIKMDRINSHSQTNFLKAEKDWLINEAGLVFLKQRSGTNNSKRKGFENTQKRIDDLSTLVIKFPEQPYLVPTLVDTNIYEIDLSTLEYNYYALTRIYCEATINGCVKTVALKFIQSDDFNDMLKDPFNSPSEDFFPYNFGKSSTTNAQSIYIYPLNSSISKVYIEYLKYPNKVSFGDYKYIDGVIYPEQTLEFPEHTHTEIIDIAVTLAATNIESSEYIQLKNSKLQINE